MKTIRVFPPEKADAEVLLNEESRMLGDGVG